MKTNGDVSAHDRAIATPTSIEHQLDGQLSIGALLRAQAAVPPRSRAARIFGKSPLNDKTKLLYRRVVGEIEVGATLDSLGAEWVVLHALPTATEGAEIDHLVIGPGGVFAIATKNFAGLDVLASERTFIAGGIRYPYIRNIEYEIGRLERMLSTAADRPVQISAILALITPKSLDVPDAHRDVAIVRAADLVGWLRNRVHTVSSEDVTSIASVAAQLSSWQQQDSSSNTPDVTRINFESLRASVRSAWKVQLTWVIGVSAVMVGAFLFVSYSILMNAVSAFAY
jgi:Nuclease-related domain